jgi:hypothetical protein
MRLPNALTGRCSMEAQSARRGGGRPGLAVAVLFLGLIALTLGGLLFFNVITVGQFVALLVLASILALGIIFTIRARSGGGKALALLGTLILLVVVSVAIIFSGAPLLLWASSPTATVNPGPGVTPTGSPGPAATPTPTVTASSASADFAVAEFGVSLISMVAGILSVIVSLIALVAARGANRPPSASGS